MKRWDLEVNGRLQTIWADRIQGDIWFHFNGRTVVIKDIENFARKVKPAAGSMHAGEIKAPMPGKVTQVRAVVGQEVRAGETLLVMEAMKMEYTLVADREGRVAKVHCRPGDPVKLGQVLVAIEAGA